MLNALRKKYLKKIIWVVVILIIVVFVFWGFGNYSRNREVTLDEGKIFGKSVDPQAFQQAMDASRHQMLIQYGDNIEEAEKNIDLKVETWNRLLLLEESKRKNIRVNDQETIELIQSYPFFQNKNGKFDSRTYSQMVKYFFRTSEREFEEETRDNLKLAKLFKKITQDLDLSDEEAKEAYLKYNQKLSLHYITALFADFIREISVSDKEIKDYYEKNKAEFKEPLSFNIEYISLAFEKNDEKQIQQKVNEFLKRLAKQESLARIAKDNKIEANETGYFSETDPIPGIGWSEEISKLIAKSKKGQLLPPLHTEKQYYILRLKDRRDPFIPEFLEISWKVKEALIRHKAKEIAKQKIENCLKTLKDIYKMNPKLVNLENSAKLHGLKYADTDLFRYGSYIEGIGASDNFWLTAQKLRPGEFSDILEMPSGFFIVRLKEKTPIDGGKYLADKEKIKESILTQKKQDYFNKYFDDLRKKALTK